MKTVIQFNKEDNRLEISDENSGNDNFVTVRIIDAETCIEADVLIDELLSAAQSFFSKRAFRIDRENLNS